MKLIRQTIKNTFADRFKRYSFLILLILAAVLLVNDRIDNGYQDPDDEKIIAETFSPDEEIAPEDEEGLAPSTIVDVPLLGPIEARDFSLPALAVILGLMDGLNPCAMWVLLYLISLVLSMNNRKRIWLVVGSFVMGMVLLGAATSGDTGEAIWQEVVIETSDVALQDLVLVLPASEQ